MIRRLYIFANSGHLNKVPKSGGQSSARRVMKGLENAGLEIIPIRRHRAESQSKIGHKMEVGLFAIIDWVKVIVAILSHGNKNAAFMQLSYSGSLIPYELFLSRTSKLLRCKNIFYLKGGKIMDVYPTFSPRRLSGYKKLMNLQQLVLFEGYDALELTKNITNSMLLYFPNYIFDDQIPDELPLKDSSSVNLCYFGRINEQKRVENIIEIFNVVAKTLTGKDVTLTLIGGSDNTSYREMIKQRIESSPYRENIKLMDRTPLSEILEVLRLQHFFIFPTETKAEGHSNSLNEAMSMGVIPIVSKFHFNETIVGNSELVVDGYNPKDYARIVINIVNLNRIPELSQEVWQRVRNMYAYSVVNKEVSDAIKSI